MAVDLRDPNQGPLTLHHDTSPRHPTDRPAPALVWQDFRYKGFPDKAFAAPKVPKYKRMSADFMNTRDENTFGRTTHFDKGNNYQQQSLNNEDFKRYTVRDPLNQYTEEHKLKLEREMRDLDEDKHQRNIIDKIRTEERQEERRKDKEMLTRYNPWGKPGGGAPANDTRKQKFLETDLEEGESPTYRDRMERERGTVENNMRYNQNRPEKEELRTELEQQSKERELRRNEDRLDNLQRELETLKHDQYGRPGGGAPNRTMQESFTDRREPMPSTESPRRAPPTFRDDKHRDDLGRSVPVADRLTRRNWDAHPIYFPFGKPGNGAPNKDFYGKLVPQLQGNLLMENYKYQNHTQQERSKEKLRAKELGAYLREQEKEQYRNKHEFEMYMKEPIGEFASIMGSKNVGKPLKDPYTGEYKNHHLGNSDVTLTKMNYQPRQPTEKRQLFEELHRQTLEKNRTNELSRMKDNQQGMLHHHTMDSTWGKPGGGAPKGFGLKKLNLETIIDHPTKDGVTFGPTYDDFSPRFHPNKYIRSTVPSTHANLYEYPEQHKEYPVY